MQTYVNINWISGGVRTPPLTSVLHNLSSRRKKRPSGPMHYIRRRAPPPRPGAAAAQFSSIARPEAATARSTRVRSSTMTSRVKTRSDSIIRRLHGGVRARSALSRSAGAMPERETRDSHTVSGVRAWGVTPPHDCDVRSCCTFLVISSLHLRFRSRDLDTC